MKFVMKPPCKPLPKLNKLTLFILIWCGMCCNACSDCDDVQTKTYDDFFEPGGSTFFISRSGYETLKYLKNRTDTIVLVGQGIEKYYEYTTRGGGDCSVDYKLLNHKIVYKNQKTNQDMVIRYHVYSETNHFGDYYEFKFGGVTIPNMDVLSVITKPKLYNIKIRDSLYSQLTFIENRGDSLYLPSNILAPFNIVRITIGKDSYELLN